LEPQGVDFDEHDADGKITKISRLRHFAGMTCS